MSFLSQQSILLPTADEELPSLLKLYVVVHHCHAPGFAHQTLLLLQGASLTERVLTNGDRRILEYTAAELQHGLLGKHQQLHLLFLLGL